MEKTFQDSTNGADGISVSHVTEKPLDASVDEHVKAAISKWTSRPDKTSDDSSAFTAMGLSAFCISYNGDSIQYAPDKDANHFNEALVRDFLFTDGICNLDRKDPRLFEVNSSMEAMEADDLLLVLPFETESGNIAGIMVVDVSEHRS